MPLLPAITRLKLLRRDESGAVTVDWVVLTAALTGLGIVVHQIFGLALTDLSDELAADLDSRDAGYQDQ